MKLLKVLLAIGVCAAIVAIVVMAQQRRAASRGYSTPPPAAQPQTPGPSASAQTAVSAQSDPAATQPQLDPAAAPPPSPAATQPPSDPAAGPPGSAGAPPQPEPQAAQAEPPGAAQPGWADSPAPPQSASGLSAADRATASQYDQKQAIALQVMLDKEGFSPGEIDGTLGKNTLRALEAYEGARKTKAGPAPNGGLRNHTLTAEDVAGPFTKIPSDMIAKSKLERLGYSSVLEKLGEQFHAKPELLRQLNPGKRFVAGETIRVPDVEVTRIPDTRAEGRPSNSGFGNVTVYVSKSRSALQVLDQSGQVIFRAAVTTGSENDPLPIGSWQVTAVARNPTFNYNPDLFWDADPSHAKARIPPGPNNPVGVVWIDLSKEHYGIHGTPEPGRIAYSESHGCIRLTNWDALKVASMVTKGTPVHLVE